MKVYQVIECSGCYEDYTEVVICTTLNENKAKVVLNEHKTKLKNDLSEFENCKNCENCSGKSCFKPIVTLDDYDTGYPHNCLNALDYWDLCEFEYEIREFDVTE